MKWLYKLDKLKILGKTYSIVYEESPYFEPDIPPEIKFGMSDITGQKIHLYVGQTKESLLDTLLHESIHVIANDLKMQFNEDDIARLAVGLQALIMENFVLGVKK